MNYKLQMFKYKNKIGKTLISTIIVEAKKLTKPCLFTFNLISVTFYHLFRRM